MYQNIYNKDTVLENQILQDCSFTKMKENLADFRGNPCSGNQLLEHGRIVG